MLMSPVVAAETSPETSRETSVVIKTSMGDITVTLDDEKAPVTVGNFLRYVDSDRYANTIFHRVIDDFMIQGGGFYEDLGEAPEGELIWNEADNGLKNRKGTIAMARTEKIDSAGRQFFINTKNNYSLDHSARSCSRKMEARQEALEAEGRFKPVTCKTFGYAVFGKVTAGMDVVELIQQVEVDYTEDFDDIPLEPVIIHSIDRI